MRPQLFAATIVFLFLTACAISGNQDETDPPIAGDWEGTLDTGIGTLRMIFHINQTDAGLSTTIDSLDQGVNGIPTSATTLTGDSLFINVPIVRGQYQATYSGNAIKGIWTQLGNDYPELTLTRVIEQ